MRTIGLPWRHGCAADAELPVPASDAPPSARLKEAGAVIVGTTTMPDLGMPASGVSSLYGITRNPWDPRRSPGGSSAGSGAALAAGIGLAMPLAHCGFTAWFNQTGQPASSLCFGLDDSGCPLAIQIEGRRFNDQRVLRAARWLEGRRPFPMAWPVTVQVEVAR